jgi:hypothetical protein
VFRAEASVTRPRVPFDFDRAVASARHSVEACVVIGGEIFSDDTVFEALVNAASMGAKVRTLLPSPRAEWLHDLASGAGKDVHRYSQVVADVGHRVASIVPNAVVRWYNSPGPIGTAFSY